MPGHEVRLMRFPLPEGIEMVVGVSDAEYVARVHTLRWCSAWASRSCWSSGAARRSAGGAGAPGAAALPRRCRQSCARRSPSSWPRPTPGGGGHPGTQPCRARGGGQRSRADGRLVSDLMLLAREDETCARRAGALSRRRGPARDPSAAACRRPPAGRSGSSSSTKRRSRATPTCSSGRCWRCSTMPWCTATGPITSRPVTTARRGPG